VAEECDWWGDFSSTDYIWNLVSFDSIGCDGDIHTVKVLATSRFGVALSVEAFAFDICPEIVQ
jgi:hypothetical protein